MEADLRRDTLLACEFNYAIIHRFLFFSSVKPCLPAKGENERKEMHTTEDTVKKNSGWYRILKRVLFK